MRSDPDLAQLGTGHHTRHARTDDRNIDVVDDRITPSHGRERILPVLREHLVVGQVPDRRPTLHRALVPLGLVLRPDRFRIEPSQIAVHIRHPHSSLTGIRKIARRYRAVPVHTAVDRVTPMPRSTKSPTHAHRGPAARQAVCVELVGHEHDLGWWKLVTGRLSRSRPR